MTIADLIANVRRYDPSLDPAWLESVYAVAEGAHREQRRASGESYIEHPLAVAAILADLEMDRQTIAAALLHDVVEDTVITSEEVGERFGEEIASLVDGVTKLERASRIRRRGRRPGRGTCVAKCSWRWLSDIRVIIIKLADRLHNMRTLGSLPPAKQQTIAQETIEIYAPIAHRLGIWRMKWDLEDLSLRYLDPGAYHDIAERVAKKRGEREAAVQRVLDELKGQFEAIGLHAEVNGRPKHFYSIHKKMQKGRDFSTIYDLTAVRIVVDSVKDCYGALGVVHSIWKPLPGRFKDYIAMPKPNMYQSLHTTVVGPGGDPLEVQIRTLEMHRTSEYGIAAHWRYKEGAKGDSFEQKLTWLRSLLEWQNDMRDSRMFMENLKLDLFESQVFIFSPKGDVFSLPAGAAPPISRITCTPMSGIIALVRRSTARSYRSTSASRTATSSRCSSTSRARGRRWIGSPSSRRRARSTRSSSGSAKRRKKRTRCSGKRCSRANSSTSACGPMPRAAK